MKSRIWIAMVLAGLIVGGVAVTPAQADDDVTCFEWTLDARKAGPPVGGDDDNAPPQEGDPENWLGGQNRSAGENRDNDWNLMDWYAGLLDWFAGLLSR